MTTLRKLCAATTLLVAFSLPTLAGTIHTDAVPPPPPQTSATAVEPTDTTVTETTSDTESLIAEITLSVLQLLPVF